MESLERHGHLNVDPDVRQRLFAASASTIDRLLKPIWEQAGSRRKRKQKRKSVVVFCPAIGWRLLFLRLSDTYGWIAC